MSHTLFRVPMITWVFAGLFVVLSCDAGSFVEPTNGTGTQDPATIELDSSPQMFTEGDTATITAVLLDEDGQTITNLNLAWSTSDRRIVEIRDDGGAVATLVAKQPGMTTITASYESLSASMEIEVHRRPVDLVYVSGSGQVALAGETLPDDIVLRAEDRRGDGVSGVVIELDVTAGGGSVAPVNGLTDVNGFFHAEWTLGAAGDQSVAARASEGQPRLKNLKDSVVVFTAQATATLESLQVSPSNAQMEEGDTLRLVAAGTASDGSSVNNPQVTWGSTDSSVVSVTAAGLLKARRPGNARAFASTTSGGKTVSDTADVSITAATATVDGVEVRPGTATVDTASARQFEAIALMSDGGEKLATVTWTATGGSITADGLYTAGTSAGSYSVIASHELGYADTATVTVVAPDPAVARVTVSPPTDTVAVGARSQLTATVLDGNANVLTDRAVSWSSNDTGVASVNSRGLVTAESVGEATITATSEGVSGSARIVVVLEVTSDPTATFYVSTTGSNSNAGTENAPWRTVEYGLRQLGPGETLFVRGGTYVENIESPSIRDGRPDARITVAAYPGERPVVQGLLWLTGADYWTLDGINVTWNPANTSGDHMVKMTRGVGWVFENAEIWNAPSMAGILVYGYGNGEPSDWVIRGNCIHDIYDFSHGSNKDHNLYINTGVDAGPGLIERNLLFGALNGQNVKLGYGSTPEPGNGTANVTVRFNTMATSLKPLLVADESHDNLIERNIILEGTENYAIRAYQLTGTNNVVTDNIFGNFDFLQYADQNEVTIAPDNLYPHDPQLDGIGCELMRPQDEVAQGYGRYAPN